LYVLLFAAPALLVSIIAAFMVSVTALRTSLISSVVPEALAVFLVGSTGLWLALLAFAFMVGKRQEARSSLNIGHVATSIVATILLVVVVSRAIGAFEAPSDSQTCADSCRTEGFAISGTTPDTRSCSCYDAEWREIRRTSLSK
jgi:uncharacterized membrane protein YidH (DUF202 family)